MIFLKLPLRQTLVLIKNLECEVKTVFDYTIFPENSTAVYNSTCSRIENAFPQFKKAKELIDVDGSTIQTYTLNDEAIKVFDDYDVGAVYVKSTFDLKEIFL